MATYEEIPAIKLNSHFPIGDQVDTYKNKKVNEWFTNALSTERDQLLRDIRLYSAPNPEEGANAYATHLGAVALCEEWDRKSVNSSPYVLMGYRLATTFLRQTRYLPHCTMDLTEDLLEMHEQTGLEYGKRVWENMETYPNVHGTFQRLIGFAYRPYELYTEGTFHNFKAGMVLPYMFAVTSQLHGYSRNTPPWLKDTDKK